MEKTVREELPVESYLVGLSPKESEYFERLWEHVCLRCGAKLPESRTDTMCRSCRKAEDQKDEKYRLAAKAERKREAYREREAQKRLVQEEE